MHIVIKSSREMKTMEQNSGVPSVSEKSQNVYMTLVA